MKPVAFEQLERAAEQVLVASGSPAAPRPAPSPGRANSRGTLACRSRAVCSGRKVAASDADILIRAERAGQGTPGAYDSSAQSAEGSAVYGGQLPALPENLLESELFGYGKGAFTGAADAKPGKFELADGGTLLLDEVGELPLRLQPKLLRVLQEREVDRLGDTHVVKLNIRVIATTDGALAAMVGKGGFRADLYYRLNVIPLSLPVLRERPEDIAELAGYFVALIAGRSRAPVLTAEFLAHMQRHGWPGNVRELADLMRRAVTLSGAKSVWKIWSPGN